MIINGKQKKIASKSVNALARDLQVRNSYQPKLKEGNNSNLHAAASSNPSLHFGSVRTKYDVR